ncbi:MAG: methyltransferase domain-containing protein [bacterium]
MNTSKLNNYNKEFLEENMMGPNSLLILEEMLDNMKKNSKLELKSGMKVLDLGCGRGLTSIYLAKEYDVEVYALDLWIPATDNHIRFKEMELEHKITPLCLDANKLPFADNYFDAIISIDSYHYFGNNDQFFNKTIKPILKKDALIGIAFPSIKHEFEFNNIPMEMKSFWQEEAFNMWRSTSWWINIFKNHLNNFEVHELKCFEQAWEDWLILDNEYAINDREMMQADDGKYMNLISFTGTLTNEDEIIDNAKQQGFELGVEEGVKQGKFEEKLEIAINLLDVLDNETIAEKTGFSIPEIDLLRQENK